MAKIFRYANDDFFNNEDDLSALACVSNYNAEAKWSNQNSIVEIALVPHDHTAMLILSPPIPMEVMIMKIIIRFLWLICLNSAAVIILFIAWIAFCMKVK